MMSDLTQQQILLAPVVNVMQRCLIKDASLACLLTVSQLFALHQSSPEGSARQHG